MEVTTEVAKVMKVMDGDLFRQQIQERLRLKNAEHLRKAYLIPAMESGLLEMTIPDKPNSRLQKYHLTEKGRQILEDMNA
jgi:ATP-dependent DNA helicase RecG